MNKFESDYRDILIECMSEGIYKEDRTGVGCSTIIGSRLKIDMSEGFPFLTGRKMFEKNPINEFLWMLHGETNVKRFTESGVKIWDSWCDENGELGPVYGYQMRNFNGSGYDQLEVIIKQMKENPNSRRHLISLWNPLQLSEQRLPPCHYSIQFIIRENELNLVFNMRSVDLYLGLPYDIALYSIWLKVIANELNLIPRFLTFSGGDCHIYSNHRESVNKYLSTEILQELPNMEFDKTKDKYDLLNTDFELKNYKSGKHIFAPVAI